MQNEKNCVDIRNFKCNLILRLNMDSCGTKNDPNTMQNLMYIGPWISVIVEERKTNLMSLAILFHFLCAQHVSDINISIIRSLRLFC